MSLPVRCAAALAAASVAAGVGATPAAAEPFPPVSGNRSASSTISDLQAKGYGVQINWTNGYDAKPLSECLVTGVNDPSHGELPPGTFTTVYVDVTCPNGDDAPSFGVGVGIG